MLLTLWFLKVYLYCKVLVSEIGRKALNGPLCHWKNAADEVRRLYETLAAYPYFHFWEGEKRAGCRKVSLAEFQNGTHYYFWV